MCHGLNFLAQCQKCQKKVVIQIGYSEKTQDDYFDVGKLMCKQNCSNCGEKLLAKSIYNILFTKCLIKFEGQYTDSSETVSVNYHDDGSGYSELIKKDENMREYAYLYARCVEFSSAY